MKGLKKILVLTIALVMCLSMCLFSACNSGTDVDNSAKVSEPKTSETVVSPVDSGQPGEQFTVPKAGESSVFDKIVESGTIRVGIAVAPPWLLQNPETSEYFGPAIDIIKKVAEICNLKIEYVDSTWDVIVAGIQADKYDVIVAPLCATEARMEVIDFVNYTEAGTAYFIRKDNKFADSLNSYADLNNPEVTIVTYTGTGNEQEIMKKYPNAKIRSIPQPPGGQPPIEDILAGRGDVGHMDSPLALKVEKDYPELKVIGGGEHSVNNPDISVPIGMGIQKNNEAFARFLQSVVDSMADHTASEIARYSLEG